MPIKGIWYYMVLLGGRGGGQERIFPLDGRLIFSLPLLALEN